MLGSMAESHRHFYSLNMANNRVLQLIPSGKKLSEVSQSLELLAAVSMGVLGALIDERPEFKDRVLTYMRATRISGSNKRSRERNAILDQAIRIVEVFEPKDS